MKRKDMTKEEIEQENLYQRVWYRYFCETAKLNKENNKKPEVKKMWNDLLGDWQPEKVKLCGRGGRCC